MEQGKPGGAARLTTDRGADIVPAAATDSRGSVWVAWQAFRNGRAQIRAARQQGALALQGFWHLSSLAAPPPPAEFSDERFKTLTTRVWASFGAPDPMPERFTVCWGASSATDTFPKAASVGGSVGEIS